jgi:hypothetical protein
VATTHKPPSADNLLMLGRQTLVRLWRARADIQIQIDHSCRHIQESRDVLRGAGRGMGRGPADVPMQVRAGDGVDGAPSGGARTGVPAEQGG